MYARHRLDIRPSDLLAAAADCLRSKPAGSDQAGFLSCFSVRSGFHLLLQALDLPLGSEVVFSAVTHPDLPRLVVHHGLVPVPVDLDPDTLGPDLGLLAEAITPNTRVVVIAHLFGGRVDLAPIAELTTRHSLLLVEDCAQAYRGSEDQGDPLAAVSMFSFGILKTATAVGGALLRVDDPALRERMATIQTPWPAQTRSRQLVRVLRCLALVLVSRPLAYGLLALLVRLAGRDLDAVVNGSIRSFKATSGAGLVHQLEQRPSRALLATLARRRNASDSRRLGRRAHAGEAALAALPVGVFHPGSKMLNRTHWLFPVVADDPDLVVSQARAAGFDAARAASNLQVVAAPAGGRWPQPRNATRMVSRLVYLPLYPEIPAPQRRRLLGGLDASRTSFGQAVPTS